MAIKVTCNSCGATLKTKDSAAGKRAKCSSCGAVIQIPDIPAGEKKVIINGLVGGILGGLLGGLLFDPISFIFVTEDGQAAASRAIGFATIGCLVGLFIGLVEGWTKTA